MMRWIVSTSLRLRFLMLVGAAMLIVFGTTQFRGMPVDVYPEFAPPRVEVQVLCLGMPAADVEALVTVPMEQALNGIEGLDVLRTRSVNDLSDVILIFKPHVNLMDARLRVQERVTAITTQLPRWATSPFMIQPLSSTSRVMKIGMTVKDKTTQNLIDTALTAYWTVRPRLMMVPGVANVAIWGDRWNVLQVHADADKMRQHRVTINGVMDAASDALDVGMLKHSSGHEIGTGGFIGSILRYLLSGYVQQLSKGLQFPFGTLAVNVVGCVLVGFLAELADQRSLISDETRGFLIVGILGGFTTFSAFGNETMNLLRSGELWLASANIVGHMLLSLIAVWFGYSAATLIWK